MKAKDSATALPTRNFSCADAMECAADNASAIAANKAIRRNNVITIGLSPEDNVSADLADRDPQIAVGVDLAGIARHQNRGGGMLLDQRRPLDAVAGEQRSAVI